MRTVRTSPARLLPVILCNLYEHILLSCPVWRIRPRAWPRTSRKCPTSTARIARRENTEEMFA